jgi:hypothetical protein
VVWVFGRTSEKGSTRKHTEKRVTSWTKMFWGNLAVSRCFAKRIIMGELRLGVFLGVWAGSHVGLLRRGTNVCFWGGL